MRAHFSKTLTDNAGNVLLNATVRVLQPGATVPIGQPLYSDDNTSNTLPNPFICTTGIIDFYLGNAQRVRVGITPSGDSNEIYFEDIDVSDVAFVAAVLDEGTSVPFRSSINFVGNGVSVLDDSATNSTIISIGQTSTTSGTGGKWVRRVVAASTASEEEKGSADYVCSGINDEEEINQAIGDVTTDKVKFEAYGGEVILGAGEFVTGNGKADNGGSIKLRSGVRLSGAGRGTMIRAAGIVDINGAFSTFVATHTQDIPAVTLGSGISNINTNARGMIELANPDDEYTEVENLMLHGNADGGARVMGIRYDSSAVTTDNPYEFVDSVNKLNRLYIYQPAGHGIYKVGVRGKGDFTSEVRIVGAGGAAEANALGMYISKPGCFYSDLDVSYSSSHGVWDNSFDSQWSNLKCSQSGRKTPQGDNYYGGGSGLWLTGKHNNYANLLCTDNTGHGAAVLGNVNTMAGFQMDSNGRIYSQGAGLLIGADGGIYFGSCFDKALNRPNQQKYGVEVRLGTMVAAGVITTWQNKIHSYNWPTTSMASKGMNLTINEQINQYQSVVRLNSRIYQGVPNYPPPIAEQMPPGSLNIWLDEVNNRLIFRVRRSTGAYQQGSIGVI